jgi:hypothetical protein
MNVIAGAITTGLAYTPMNPCVGLLQDAGFWRAVAIGAAAGAAAGLASALLPALLPVASLGFWGTVGVGTLSEATGGAAGQLVYNQWTGAPLMDNVGWAALSGAVAGALFSAVGYGLGRLAKRVGGWLSGRGGQQASQTLRVDWQKGLSREEYRNLTTRMAKELVTDGTEMSNRIASRIDRGALFPTYLSNKEFNSAYLRRNPGAVDVERVLAFTTGNENIYLRAEGKGFPQLVLATLHEGTHFDTTWGGRLSGMTVLDYESLAYHAELEFAASKGWLQYIPKGRRTAEGITEHIMKNYRWWDVFD